MIASWSPVTKLLVAAAALAVPYLLWTMPESGSTPGVARPVTRAGAAGPVAGQAAPAAPAATTTSSEAAPSSAPARPRSLPSLQTFAAVVERPLFAPTRRFVRPFGAPPPEPEPVAEAEAEAPPPEDAGPERPDLRFFGTIRQGGKVAALVTAAGETGVERLKIGDAVGAWQVADVTRDRLVLMHQGEELEYSIFGTTDEGSGSSAGEGRGDEPKAAGDGAASGGDEN